MKQPSTTPKLLIIDDDEPTRILIRDILEGANVTIMECGCGNEALCLFKKYAWEFDLVLLDIHLPGCMGWELLKQFRQMNPLVPIIAVSAILPEALKENCSMVAFDAYIPNHSTLESLKN